MFFNLIDITQFNANVLYKLNTDNPMARRNVIISIVESLVEAEKYSQTMTPISIHYKNCLERPKENVSFARALIKEIGLHVIAKDAIVESTSTASTS